MKTILRYKNISLLEGNNTFMLRYGTRPSFGTFRCTSDDYDSLITSNGDMTGLVHGSLIFGSDDDTDKVELFNVYLVKATLDSTTGVYTIILADKRILLLHSFGAKDYNTYKSQDTVGDEYELTNFKVGTTEWTYQDVLTDLSVQGGLTITNTRKLRNVRGMGLSKSDILDRLLYDSCSYMVLDPIMDSYAIYKLNEADASTSNDDKITKDVTTITNSLVISKPTSILAFYADSVSGNYFSTSSSVSGGASGNRAFMTSYTDSDDGVAATQDFGDEMAIIYETAGTNARDTLYKGILPIVASNIAHVITWTMDMHGARTRVQRFFPIHDPDQIPSNLFAHNGFLDTLGGNRSGIYPGTIRQVISANVDGYDYLHASSLLP